ncbi:MAG: T9SS type A sorting domain-containing protein, partial [Flavobacteriaceae bacterium]
NAEKPTAAGQYEVLATVDDTNYEGQTEGTFVLTAVLDVIEGLRPVSVYPNPATDKFKVSTVESSELGVYDLNGTLLIRASTNQFVDVRNLNNGVYLVLAKNKIMRLVIGK